jgi:Na+/glutamate symporter
VVLVAAVAALNVAISLYLLGDWICKVPPAFTECRIPDPLGGISFLDADLLASPSILVALLGAS